MRIAPRRAILAGALAGCLPHGGWAQPVGGGAGADLQVLVAVESVALTGRVLDDLLLNANFALPGATLELADLSWISTELRQGIAAGKPSADVVLCNVAGFALGATRDLWQPLPANMIQAALAVATPAGVQVQAMLGDAGMVVAAAPGGPILLHRPSGLPAPPQTPAALLDFARENPRRFQYARPGQSRFGQVFVNALPHLLGDHEPADPMAGWPRTWEYLAELGRHVGYYPSSGEAALEEFAEGGSDLMPCLLASYMSGVAANVLPADTRCVLMEGGPLLSNSMILTVPRAIPSERLPVIADFADFLLTPTTQMRAFGRGLIPGHNATGELLAGIVAPADLWQWTRLMTPELAQAFTSRNTVPPLAPGALAAMIRRWDESIGARFGETP